MLFWELLRASKTGNGLVESTEPGASLESVRLPFDTRCSMITKRGRRCRGHVRKGADWCTLHDPAVMAKRRQRQSSPRRRNTLAHLPDGYLRKLTSTATVGNAMDRLYREVRLGVVTPEMGSVLFGILTRLMDSGLLDVGKTPPHSLERTKAARIRPKLRDLLTRSERKAWAEAIAAAPDELATTRAASKKPSSADAATHGRKTTPRRRSGRQPVTLSLQAS